jgi:penicillin-binding protein 1A
MGRTRKARREPLPFTFTAPPGPRPRRRRLRWARLAFGTFLWLLLALVSMFYGFITAVAQEIPRLDPAKLYHEKANGVVYAGDGHTVLAILRSDENRKPVTYDQIAPVMQQAILAVEDKRFYEHGAVDPIGLARAAVVDLQGGHVQGGSTITQQLVKNVYTGGARSFRRKFMEAALAYQLEQEWPKRRILTAYLNTVFFGHHAYGVEAAAEIYFGTHARSLQPWQAALLAGLVKGPSEYDPVAHPYKARARRNLVLRLMLQEGKISATDYAYYIRQRIIPKGHKVELPATTRGVAPYFTQYVIDQLVARFGRERAYGGGLRVYTTIDLKLQDAAAKAVKLKLKHVGPSGALVSIDPKSGQIKVMVGGANYRQSQFNLAAQAHRQPGSAFKPFVLLAALQAGIQPQTVFDSKPQFIQTGGTVVPITNDEGSYMGWIPLSTAMTYSDNAVYTQLAVRVGLGKVRTMAHRLGVISPLDANLAMSLGGLRFGVSPLEMAHAYATIANEGVRVGGSLRFRQKVPGEQPDTSLDPIAITKILDRNGRLVADNKPKRVRVVSQDNALTTLKIMKTVLSAKGTARLISDFPRPAAGKTGTTSNFVDAWFVGMTPQLSTAVWVGYPNYSRPMDKLYGGKPVFGGTYPALIWKAFNVWAIGIDKLPWADWEQPVAPAAEPVSIDTANGLRAPSGCPRARTMYFAVGRAPNGVSSCSGSFSSTPDLVGTTATEARHLLDLSGLKTRVTYRAALHGEVPGTVLLQAPAAAEPARAGQKVTIVLAKRVIEVTLPDVRGEPRAVAVSELKTAGFKVRVQLTADSGAPPGRVVAQTLDPGLQPRGARITLLVRADATGTGG